MFCIWGPSAFIILTIAWFSLLMQTIFIASKLSCDLHSFRLDLAGATRNEKMTNSENIGSCGSFTMMQNHQTLETQLNCIHLNKGAGLLMLVGGHCREGVSGCSHSEKSSDWCFIHTLPTSVLWSGESFPWAFLERALIFPLIILTWPCSCQQ